MSFVRKHGFKIAVLALCAAMAVYLYVSREGGVKLAKIKAAPEFALANLDGSTVTLADTSGKVRLYYFYFASCPDVCPPTTAQLAKVQEEMNSRGSKVKDRFLLTSITIDPELDTPEVIREFADKFEIDYSNWHFLRGDEQQTHELAESFGLSVFRDNNGDLTHTNIIFLVDADGMIRKYIMGTNSLTASEIITDVESLLKE